MAKTTKPRKATEKPPRERKASPLEDKLYEQLSEHNLRPDREYQFYPGRRWRSDLAFPQFMILVEVEGGLRGSAVICDKCHKPVMRVLANGRRFPIRDTGRHNSAAGFEKDIEKYNRAEVEGWTVIRVSSSMVRNGKACEIVCEAVEAAKERAKNIDVRLQKLRDEMAHISDIASNAIGMTREARVAVGIIDTRTRRILEETRA